MAHEVHEVEEAGEYLPNAQAPVTAERPVVAQYEPAGHSTKAVEPVVAWYVPIEQLLHWCKALAIDWY